MITRGPLSSAENFPIITFVILKYEILPYKRMARCSDRENGGRWGGGREKHPDGGVRVGIRIWTWHIGGTIRLRLKRGRCVFSRGFKSKQEKDVKSGGKGSGRESSRGAEVGENQTCTGNKGFSPSIMTAAPTALGEMPAKGVNSVFPGGLHSLRTRMGPFTQTAEVEAPTTGP